MAGNSGRYGVSGRTLVYRHEKPGTKPPVSAGDAEYEQSQPISQNDRRAMLRRHFAAGGMTNAQVEAALSRAKV